MVAEHNQMDNNNIQQRERERERENHKPQSQKEPSTKKPLAGLAPIVILNNHVV